MSDYREIFDRLRARAPAIARSSAAERIEKLRRLYRAAYELRMDIGAAGREEIAMDGRLHLPPLKEEVDFVCARLEGWMARQEVEPVPSLMGRRAYIQYEPKGVVLHLSTWNSPVLMSLAPVVNMISAGNAVVLKPSEVAPASAEVVRRVIERAGLTEEIAVVTGGPEVAQALLELPFDHIGYVGNNRIGRLVMEAAAKHFAGVTLEMGGKNPVVVATDADLEDTAAKIAHARHLLCGQVCLSPDYVLVDRRVRDAFVQALRGRIRAMFDPSGAGFRASPDLPRIINARHVRRIAALIEDARAKGARIILGSEVDEAARYVSPTLLEGVTADMDIFWEEIFGPVQFVQGFATREEAVAEIARRPKPLGLYVFTRDRATADWFIENTRAGTSAVNNAVVQGCIPTLPFGEANHSGIGRIGGHAGFLEFSNARSVVEDALDPRQGAPMFYPPHPPEAAAWVDQLLAPSA